MGLNKYIFSVLLVTSETALAQKHSKLFENGKTWFAAHDIDYFSDSSFTLFSNEKEFYKSDTTACPTYKWLFRNDFCIDESRLCEGREPPKGGTVKCYLHYKCQIFEFNGSEFLIILLPNRVKAFKIKVYKNASKVDITPMKG